MARKFVLIVTNRYDSHADYMIQKFSKRKIPFIRFNSDDYPKTNIISVTIDNMNGFKIFSCISGDKCKEEDIRSIWFRRPLQYQIDNSVVDKESRRFAEDETNAFIEGLWSSFSCYWISKPSNIRLAQQKLLQLCRAKELGFKVPHTLVTNNPIEFKDFFDHCNGEVIYKTLGRNQTRNVKGKSQFAYTNKLSKGFFEHADEIALAPCLFQEYIPKKVELRATIVQEQIFTCEIHSQKSAKTRIDWRRYDIKNTPHLPIKMPEEINKKCLDLVHSFGLQFGAIDLIITPSDECVFIEINPNGQWLWIEQLTGLQISEALFHALVQKPLV